MPNIVVIPVWKSYNARIGLMFFMFINTYTPSDVFCRFLGSKNVISLRSTWNLRRLPRNCSFTIFLSPSLNFGWWRNYCRHLRKSHHIYISMPFIASQNPYLIINISNCQMKLFSQIYHIYSIFIFTSMFMYILCFFNMRSLYTLLFLYPHCSAKIILNKLKLGSLGHGLTPRY